MNMAVRLGRAAQAERLRADLDLLEIAAAAGVSEATLSRFEAGRGWRRQTNEIVAAYAHMCGLRPEDLWLAALHAAE